jgi:hypothetical protein
VWAKGEVLINKAGELQTKYKISFLRDKLIYPLIDKN